MQQYLQRIFDSGLFSSVEIIKKIVDKEKGLVNIEIKLREYKSSSIEATFGFRELSTFQENTSSTGCPSSSSIWYHSSVSGVSHSVPLPLQTHDKVTGPSYLVYCTLEPKLVFILGSAA